MPPLHIDRPADGVVLLTLDIPERRNAMTEELTAAWAEAIGRLLADSQLRCVVVTGAGPAFCAGGDLSWIEAGGSLEVPTLAAVNGAAIGAGLALALACDLRYSVPEARLSAPFTLLGMHAGMATTWLLPEVAGLPVARELLFTGRTVSGAEAVSLGLINRIFPPETFLTDVLQIARTIASRAPLATRLTKVALAGAGHPSFDAALTWESLAQPVTMAASDLREGLRAQRERRPPRFTGT